MKTFLACFYGALLYSTRSWVLPHHAISTVIAPVAQASMFSGTYNDPNHPNCRRQIQVLGSQAILTGTDGNPGCPPDGSGEEWQLLGQIVDDTILVDFSPKGGPKDLKGVWDTTDPAGILWPDGNKWTLKT